MTRAQQILREAFPKDREAFPDQQVPPTPIDRILQKLSRLEIPAKEHLEDYLRHKVRLNHKPRTLSQSFTSAKMFLTFYQGLGKSWLEGVAKEDLEGFIEHEQDRGIKITSLRTRMAYIIAFLHFLIEQEIISGAVLKKRIKLKLPETLPRAINPLDVKRLLFVIEDTQERALILILLRTGL